MSVERCSFIVPLLLCTVMYACVCSYAPCLSCVVSVSSPNTTIFMVQSIKCAEDGIIKHLDL